MVLCSGSSFLDNQVALFKLPIAPAASVLINRPPEDGKHIKAIVKAAISGPMLRHRKRLYCVQTFSELLKVVAADSVPVTVPIGPPDIFWHVCQGLDVCGRGLHQVVVVLHRGKDHRVVFWVLVPLRLVGISLVLFVYKQALDPAMAYAAGVTGQIHPLGELVDASETSAQIVESPLRELCGLINKYPVVLLPGVFPFAVIPGPVPEAYG